MKTQQVLKRGRKVGLSDKEMAMHAGCSAETIRDSRVNGREMAFNKVWPVLKQIEVKE